MKRHLTAEEISKLVHGTLARERAASFHMHLADCEGCAAVWAQAIRYRAAWLRRGKSSGLPRRVSAMARDSGPNPMPALPRVQFQDWLPAAGVAMTIIVVGAWTVIAWRAAPTLGFNLTPAVRAGVESSSARELVLPGGERRADRPAAEMRSGGGASSPEFARELEVLTSRYEAGDRSADAAGRLVAALLATGDLEAANAYAREGLRAHPQDVRLLVLMADLKYRASDLAAAESHLRGALQIAPRDPIVGLDLSLVLRERGDARGAKEGLERVSAHGPRTLAERASQELRR